MTMREAFVAAATNLLDEKDRTTLILADIGYALFRESGAVEKHSKRVVNVGIREQLMIGVAGGFALEGYRPIVHTYAPFLAERPYEQIKLDLGHQGSGAVLVSVGASYDAASAGRTHQAPEDVALMRTIPGCSIYAPGHADEVEPILRHAVETDGIVYIRLSDESNETAYPFDPPSVIARGGADAPTIIAVGPAMLSVAEACSGLDVTLIYTSAIEPLDSQAIQSHAAGNEVILVEPYLEGTSAAAISRIFSGSPRRFLAIGTQLTEHRRYGSAEAHRKAHGLDAQSIRDRIQRFRDAT